MGVPVISLAGQTHVARMGLSILSAIGLSEFVAYSEQDYIDLCVRLANSIDQLRTLRAGMRDRLISSALMDEVGYTRALENLLQTLAGRSRGADGHS